MREPQGLSQFVPGDPNAGYYNDLRGVVRDAGDAVQTAFQGQGRATLNPVTAAQVGLGAWQLLGRQPERRALLEAAVEWLLGAIDSQGRLPYHEPMRHTYRIAAPWYSAMAQGQAASLLVRAADALSRPELLDVAAHIAGPLHAGEPPLVAHTDEGPVLQEYPTEPPAHVLNGWIFGLWGLYDVGTLSKVAASASSRAAFAAGSRALARRLALYEVGHGWSRYDLYPHPLAHVASPFYHRLHVAQLRAMSALVPAEPFLETAERWERAAGRPASVVTAVARKAVFRAVRPRSRAA